MIENVHTVAIGEIVVSDAAEDVLVAFGLGSCVAVCLYDPVARIGGMLHALLPTVSNGREKPQCKHSGLSSAQPGVFAVSGEAEEPSLKEKPGRALVQTKDWPFVSLVNQGGFPGFSRKEIVE